jgi:HlyD family secretion protein
MFSKKTLRITVISTVCLLIFLIIGKTAGWFGGVKPVKVAIETVAKRTIYEIVTADGKIQPETEVKISADVSGEVVEILFKEGDSVKKGDLLLKIKPDIYLSSKQRAEASVDAAKASNSNANARLEQIEAQFKQTELAHERNKKLWEQKIISQSDWDNSVAAFEVAQANVKAAKQDVKGAEFSVKSAEASLREANERLIKTSVFSPIDGIITRFIVEKGERVAGTDLMAGTEMIRIADLKNMEVKVNVNENDIVRVKIGDTANIEVDAYLGQKFKGIVSEIANSASSANSTQISADQITNYEVKILMIESSYRHLVTKNQHYPFRPGMTATVEIQTNKKDNVLSIPIEAITTRLDSLIEAESSKKDKVNVAAEKNNMNKDKVSEIAFKLKNSYAFTEKVKTGIQDNTYIEIEEGLREGDNVVVAPYSAIKKLKDSTLIKIVDKKELFTEK